MEGFAPYLLGLIGTIFGIIFGSVLQHVLSMRSLRKQLFFNARLNLYSKIFLGLHQAPEDDQEFQEMAETVVQAIHVSDGKLSQLLMQYISLKKKLLDEGINLIIPIDMSNDDVGVYDNEEFIKKLELNPKLDKIVVSYRFIGGVLYTELRKVLGIPRIMTESTDLFLEIKDGQIYLKSGIRGWITRITSPFRFWLSRVYPWSRVNKIKRGEDVPYKEGSTVILASSKKRNDK